MYTSRGDRSSLEGSHCCKDHTADEDNFVILSLAVEHGRPHYNLEYQFLREIPRSRRLNEGQSACICRGNLIRSFHLC